MIRPPEEIKVVPLDGIASRADPVLGGAIIQGQRLAAVMVDRATLDRLCGSATVARAETEALRKAGMA